MESKRLRIASETRQTSWEHQRTKCIRFKDLLNVLREAGKENLAWMEDFADDPVQITDDLYEVITVYRQLSRAA